MEHALRLLHFQGMMLERLVSIRRFVSLGSYLGLGVLALSGCTDKSERSAAKAPSVLSIPVPSPTTTTATADQRARDPRILDADPTEVRFLLDGTLAVATEREIVTIDASGSVQRRSIPQGKTVRISEYGEGIVLEGESDAILLRTPALDELFSGPARTINSGTALMSGEPPALAIAQVHGKMARYELSGAQPITIEAVTFSSDRKFAIVTWTESDPKKPDDTIEEAAIFDAANGRRIGRGLPLVDISFGLPPRATFYKGLEYGIDGGQIVAIDLATAAVVRKTKLACGKDLSLGNPMVNPTGDLLLITCGDDGLTFDARTLAPKKRLHRLMPGCDNGDILPAHFDPVKRGELVIEGCGGEARLQVTTGKYRCSDSEGLAGAPYELVPGMHSSRERALPADRLRLPLCTTNRDEMQDSVGVSGQYRLVITMGENFVLRGPASAITLENGAWSPVISSDETRVAYMLEGRVVVRSLPAGTPLLELVHR